MAAHGRKKKHEDHGEHPDERWLVTYADLLTLLMVLFMVLFSISAVNKSKFETLQRSLAEAFSGKVLPGGHGIMQNGGSNNVKNPSDTQPYSSIQPFTGGEPNGSEQGSQSNQQRAAAAAAEQERLKQVQQKVKTIAKSLGLSGKVSTRITPDGLYIRVLTDDLLFDSGSSIIRPGSIPLLRKIGGLLAAEGKHPILVEGHTDNVPVTGRYPSNWELSTDRAAGVVRQFQSDGVAAQRLTPSGKAQLDPVASNETAAGRSLNRRVDILLPRLATAPAADTADTTTTSTSVLNP